MSVHADIVRYSIVHHCYYGSINYSSYLLTLAVIDYYPDCMHAVMETDHRNVIIFIESYLQGFRCYVRCLLSMLDRAQNAAAHGCHSEIGHLDGEKTALMSPQST